MDKTCTLLYYDTNLTLTPNTTKFKLFDEAERYLFIRINHGAALGGMHVISGPRFYHPHALKSKYEMK